MRGVIFREVFYPPQIRSIVVYEIKDKGIPFNNAQKYFHELSLKNLEKYSSLNFNGEENKPYSKVLEVVLRNIQYSRR